MYRLYFTWIRQHVEFLVSNLFPRFEKIDFALINNKIIVINKITVIIEIIIIIKNGCDLLNFLT